MMMRLIIIVTKNISDDNNNHNDDNNDNSFDDSQTYDVNNKIDSELFNILLFFLAMRVKSRERLTQIILKKKLHAVFFYHLRCK